MCVLDQKSLEVKPIQQFIIQAKMYETNMRANSTPPKSIILKTIDDGDSFCFIGLTHEAMNPLVRKVILVGLFLLIFCNRVTYGEKNSKTLKTNQIVCK